MVAVMAVEVLSIVLVQREVVMAVQQVAEVQVAVLVKPVLLNQGMEMLAVLLLVLLVVQVAVRAVLVVARQVVEEEMVVLVHQPQSLALQ
jgi:hypothetical protein